jgi:hypothetical protein
MSFEASPGGSMRFRRFRNLALSFITLSVCMLCFNNCTEFSPTSMSKTPSAADLAFQCQVGTPIQDTEVRLTGVQFQNTLQALLMAGITTADVANLNSFYASTSTVAIISSFPAEGTYGLGNAMIYDTQDQRLTMTLIQSQVSLVLAATQWLVSDSNRLSYFVNYYAGTGICPSNVGNTGAPKSCYDAFIKSFGLVALRRPVEVANSPIDASATNPAAMNDLTFYETVYSDPTNGGFDAVVGAMVLSPDSLFFNQVKGTANGTQITLTNYETAAKLSYYYTNNPPDSQLAAAATSGFSGTGNSIAEQADRLFASPLARARFTDFYSQWIRPDAIPNLTAASNAPTNMDLTQLRTNAIQEMVDLTEYYTFGAPNGKLSDMVSSNISFAKTTDLASLYGVATWPGKNPDGSYNSSTFVNFPAASPRAGLFTRAGYAFSGARDNNLIIRGSRLRKDYMCANISPPAAFVLSTTIPIQGPPTVRNIVIANTESPGSLCISCHQPLINPLGFALENYDSFGRYRTAEPIFNTDGTINTTVPVNAESAPFASVGNPTQVTDPIAFSNLLGQDSGFNACFVQHYFRYSEARSEDLVADSCQLNMMMGAMVNDPSTGSIQAMVKSVATSPTFQTRNITP